MSHDRPHPSNGNFDQVALYRPELQRLATRLVSRQMQARIDPSDVVQETLLTASKELPKLSDAKVSILVWLYKLLRQRVIDAKRRHMASAKRSVYHEKRYSTNSSHKLALEHLPAFYQSRPQSELSALTRLQKLEQAIQALPPDTQVLLRLRYFESLSLTEIAQRLGISLSAMKMRHSRALLELRKVLDDA